MLPLFSDKNGRQEVSIWAWSREDSYYDTAQNQTLVNQADIPMMTGEIPDNADTQHTVCFDAKNKLSIVSTGMETVILEISDLD